MKPLPPNIALRFLRWFCREDYIHEIEGDLIELFEKRHTQSPKKAKRLLVWDVIKSLRLRNMKSIGSYKGSNITAMYQHYFKIAWRNLHRYKMYSFIKIGGFAIGIAACILIALFIKDEMSYDKHYVDGDQIFRLANDYNSPTDQGKWTLIQAPIRTILYENFPEIDRVARFHVRVGENQFRRVESKQNVFDQGFVYADPEILEILEVPMVYGSQVSALVEPNSIVLSKSKANKYFPNEDPVGKQVALNDGKKILTVGGVMEDFPSYSHLQYDFIITLSGFEFWPGEQTSWCCNNYEYYLKLKPDTDKLALEDKLIYIRDNFVLPQLLAKGSVNAEDVKKYQSYYLQPIENIYLNPEDVGDNLSKHGIIEIVWILGIIALIILLLAVINFVNLSTAKSANKAKEVGLRKVIGSYRTDLIGQYLSESILYSLASIFFGVLLSWLALPLFNTVSDKTMLFPWFEWWFLPALLSTVLVVGLMSGFYPSLYLSSFKPVDVLKGKISLGSKSSGFRSALVVFQFTASIVLIISALIVHKQMKYFLTKELGFNKDQVITIQSAGTMGENQLSFKNELLKRADVQHVTISDFLPIAGTDVNNNTFWNEGRKELDQGVEARIWRVDYDYIKTLGIKLSQGRDFSEAFATDTATLIINKAMAKVLGLIDPIGAKIVSDFDPSRQVIGVVDDFHFGSLANPISPLCMVLGKFGANVIVKTQSNDMSQTITSIESVWDEFMPNQSIRYGFLNDRFARTDTNAMLQRIESIFIFFAGLAIFIACLGLFALSAFIVEQRSKEISIRKVLGASITSILSLLTLNFVKLILIAMVVAIPAGWYFMDWFLADFAYRIEITWGVFAVSGLVTILIALITVGNESIRAAIVNPVSGLRSE